MDTLDSDLRDLRAVATVGREAYDSRDTFDAEGFVTYVVRPRLTRILRTVANKIERRHAIDPVEYIVHYTSIGTIISMLQAQIDKNNRAELLDNAQFADETFKTLAIGKGGSLRLYDSAHSNDPAEGEYLTQQLVLTRGHNWLQPAKQNHAYLASFIIPERHADEAGDNLIFWRTYGDEGEGISLKIEPPIPYLRKVIYGGNELKRTIDDLDTVLQIIEPLGAIGDLSINLLLSDTIHEALGKVTHLYKSLAYQYERECRYVVLPNKINESAIKFDHQHGRNGSNQLRHYYETESLDIEAIFTSGSSITVGPCVENREDVRNSIEKLTRRAGLLGPQVKLSEIVYRRT